MSRARTEDKIVLKDLGDGLVLRRSTPRDTEAIARYNMEVLGPNDNRLGAWMRDLMRGTHPTFGVGDYTFVEDTKTGKIVSSLNLISQRWSYAGIEFGVGRPEVVSTHPDYRRRGLVRAQFEVVHEWSAQRGEKMTAITGIPYFYRQFGYEMAVDLGGGKGCRMAQIPGLQKGQREPYRVRSARDADIPFLARLYKEATKRYLLTSIRDSAMWRYDLRGRRKQSSESRQICVVETARGRRVGLLVHLRRLWGGESVAVGPFEIVPGLSWLSVTPSVLRYLRKAGDRYARKEKKQCRGIMFWHGAEHPVYEVFPDRLQETQKPYAWYIRVPNLPDFLRHISPVLEQRLAGSALTGHTGEIKLSFYRTGLRMVFRRGRLAKVESWTPATRERAQAGFPDLTFLQLLFGYRTLDELDYAIPDCWAYGDGTRALLNALFPKQPSAVWPVG